MTDAYIVEALRVAGGRKNGALAAWHPADLAAEVLNAIVDRITGDVANEETVATLRKTGAPCVEKPFRVQQFISVVEQTMGKAQ